MMVEAFMVNHGVPMVAAQPLWPSLCVVPQGRARSE